jgi:hypothetical protein
MATVVSYVGGIEMISGTHGLGEAGPSDRKTSSGSGVGIPHQGRGIWIQLQVMVVQKCLQAVNGLLP